MNSLVKMITGRGLGTQLLLILLKYTIAKAVGHFSFDKNQMDFNRRF